MLTSIARAAAAMFIVTAGMVAMTAATTVAAAAADGDCIRGEMKEVNNKLTYVCYEYADGSVVDGAAGGTGGTGGAEEPSCDLTGGLYNDFCQGTSRCFINDPAALQDTADNGLSEESKPNPDSYAVYWECERPDGTTYELYYWNDDQPTVTIEDRVRSAIGALELPTVEATFNPPGRTLVNLPTWWWAAGAPAGEIRGSEALGLVAIATPRGLSVVPGDGAPSMACPMSVTKSDACSYTYRRAGQYTATMSIVYDLRFEMGGTTLPAGDVPAEFRTMTIDDEVPVTVREVQTRVTGVR